MLSQFWEGLGSQLGERFVSTVLSPAFIFWLGGAAAWVSAHRHRTERWIDAVERLTKGLPELPVVVQGALVVGVLLVVAGSGLVVQRLALTVIRALEGYWPKALKGARSFFTRRQSSRIDKLDSRWRALAAKGVDTLSREERVEYVTLDWRLRGAPRKDRRMPTSLGNILRAAEARPYDRYGLDATKCWPRLWLILPENVRSELTAARGSLDGGATAFLWGLLFVIWTVWAWWAAPSGLLLAVFAYRSMLTSASVYGDLLVSAFDLHRRDLYRSLRWPLPTNPAEEPARGRGLTLYLWRGSDDQEPSFTEPPGEG
jgi:hypothetical protein